MLKIREIDIEEFENIRGSWNNLLLNSSDPNFFKTWEWLISYWKTYGKKYRKPIILTAEVDYKLVGAIALRKDRRYISKTYFDIISFLSQGPSDYNDVILHREADKHKMLYNILNYIGSCIKWDLLYMNDVPEHSSLSNRKLFNQFSMKIKEETKRVSYIKLPDTWKGFLSTLSANLRKNIRSKEKRLKRLGKVKFETINSPSVKDFDIFVDLNLKRWRSRYINSVLQDDLFYDFHKNITKTRSDSIVLEYLWVNDNIISSIYGFQFEKKFYVYLTGMDPDFARYSPGNLIFAMSIKDKINRRFREYDLLRGKEEYKLKWTKTSRKNYNYIYMRKSIRKILLPIKIIFWKLLNK